MIDYYYEKVKQRFSTKQRFIKNLLTVNEKKNSSVLRLNQKMLKLLIISKCLDLTS